MSEADHSTATADATALTRTSDAEILAVTRHQAINLIWERNQRNIALLTVVMAEGVAVYLALAGHGGAADRAFQFLTNSALLVIGFYFGRTNHTRPTGERT